MKNYSKVLTGVVVAAFVLVGGASFASAQTITVDNTDSNCGTSTASSSPYCAIQTGVGAASSGDTVEITGGPYNISSAVNVGVDITIQAVSGETPVVNRDEDNGNDGAFRLNAADITLNGLEINTDANSGSPVAVRINASDVEVSDLIVNQPADEFHAAIQVTGNHSNLSITGNNVTGGAIGLGGATDSTISNNTVDSVKAEGIFSASGAGQDLTLEGNAVTNHDLAGGGAQEVKFIQEPASINGNTGSKTEKANALLDDNVGIDSVQIDDDGYEEPTSETVVVNPDNMNGWEFAEEQATGTGMLVDGPGTPPAGDGSAKLQVDSDGRMLLGKIDFAGTDLSDISELKYSTYISASSSFNTSAASFQINVDYDGSDENTDWQGRLVYEPYQNGSVEVGEWQEWDVTQGEVWASGSPGNNQCPQSDPCTWNELISNYPDAEIRDADYTGFLFKAGGPWEGGFIGNVDNFKFAVKNSTTIFDFEPTSTGGNDGGEIEDDSDDTGGGGGGGGGQLGSSDGGGSDDGDVAGEQDTEGDGESDSEDDSADDSDEGQVLGDSDEAPNDEELRTLLAQAEDAVRELATKIGGANDYRACSYVWTRDLGQGAQGADVLALQTFLNMSSDTQVAATGAGSAGQETDYYGGLTASAVSSFQSKYASTILAPLDLTAPTGYFGASSRDHARTLCQTDNS